MTDYAPLQSSSRNDIAVAAYVTPIGWMLAMIVRDIKNDRSDFTTFHLRQSLGLSLLEIFSYVLFYYLVDAWLLAQFAIIILFLFAVVGINSARVGRRRYQPFLGKLYHNLFTFI